MSRLVSIALVAACAACGACGASRPATTGPGAGAAAVDAAPAAAPPATAPPGAGAVVRAPVEAAPAPLPLDRDMPALAARLVELYRAAADAMVAAGTDCGRASTDLGGVRDRFRDVRDAVARVVADGRSGQLEPELDRQRDPIAAALQRMQPTLDACRSDARLDAALDGLAGGG